MTERHLSSQDFAPKTPEISQELLETFTERRADKHYLLGCGDDRDPLDTSDEYLRFFGGAAGIAKIVMLAKASKENGTLVDGDTYGATISEVARKIMSAPDTDIEPVLHSAQANENGAHSFQPSSENPPGCAYGAGFVAVSRITLTL